MFTPIVEGHYKCTREPIEYPEVSSCITVTCIFPGSVFVGGHFVMFPDTSRDTAQEPTIEALSNAMRQAAQPHLPLQRLYIVGDINNEFWKMPENMRHITDLKELFRTARDQADNTVTIDTGSYGSVDVEVYPHGLLTVTDRHGQVVYTSHFNEVFSGAM